MFKKLSLLGALAAIAIAMACGDKSPSPVSPSSSPVAESDAAPDGSTLKATAPTAVSPIGGGRIDTLAPTLVISDASGKFTTAGFAYQFNVLNDAGTVVRNGSVPGGNGAAGANRTAFTFADGLESDKTYRWRARATFQGTVGPWSTEASFLTPELSEGYIRGSEVFDPLTNGKTIGQISGPVTFIPGVGVRLESFQSHITYELATLTAGEFSLVTTGMPTNTEGNKTKILSMQEGGSDLITNSRRMTVEKRGNPAGVIAWRFITSSDQVDTVGGERVVRNFNPNLSYLWRATWGGRFNLQIFEGSRQIYGFGKSYSGVYDPRPHRAYVGAPIGRSGASAGSVPGVIVRNVWISNRPRPQFPSIDGK